MHNIRLDKLMNHVKVEVKINLILQIVRHTSIKLQIKILVNKTKIGEICCKKINYRAKMGRVHTSMR